MSDQKFPDGEMAKVALSLAQDILFNVEGRRRDGIKREDYLKAVAESVRALKGYDP